MFTWICPQCGREVPPSYTECPDCARRAAEPQPEKPAETPVPPPEPARPPAATPQAHTYPQHAQAAASPAPPWAAQAPVRGGLPTWLLTLLFAFAFLGVGSGIYWLLGYYRNRPIAAVESPAAKPGAARSPLQKYIEISGIRFVQNPKRDIDVRFVVVNHSPAEIQGMAANVTVWGRTQKSEEEAAGTFNFTTNLGPWETKDLTARLSSKHKIYELPDWQNVSTDVQITSPAQ